jgi:hypothetical protein
MSVSGPSAVSARFRQLCRAVVLLVLLVAGAGCAGYRHEVSPAFSIAQNQKMLPVLPFSNILVPTPFAESVFNDFVDDLNENGAKTGFTWFGIIKENLSEVENILSPGHIYLTGEVWSYLENSGCCATEIRVSSRLRIHRVRSRELLWETEIPLEGFFEHDKSTLEVEREKLAKRLAAAMADEAIKALRNAKRIQID